MIVLPVTCETLPPVPHEPVAATVGEGVVGASRRNHEPISGRLASNGWIGGGGGAGSTRRMTP